MAHSLSAKKRIRQNAKRQVRNRARKTRIKTEVRKLNEALAAGSTEQASEQLVVATRVIDKVADAGTIHKNKAARLKSRLAKRINKAQKTA